MVRKVSRRQRTARGHHHHHHRHRGTRISPPRWHFTSAGTARTKDSEPRGEEVETGCTLLGGGGQTPRGNCPQLLKRLHRGSLQDEEVPFSFTLRRNGKHTSVQKLVHSCPKVEATQMPPPGERMN